jgi:hypothetical protein
VPAAAVIPAPIAYIKVVAVKKSVVEPHVGPGRPSARRARRGRMLRSGWRGCPSLGDHESGDITLKKLECLKQACACIH